jgi:hypothetical protein
VEKNIRYKEKVCLFANFGEALKKGLWPPEVKSGEGFGVQSRIAIFLDLWYLILLLLGVSLCRRQGDKQCMIFYFGCTWSMQYF